MSLSAILIMFDKREKQSALKKKSRHYATKVKEL